MPKVEEYWKNIANQAKEKGLNKTVVDVERAWRETRNELAKEKIEPNDEKYNAELILRTKKKILGESKNNFEIILEQLHEQIPYGIFYGSSRMDTYTYFGNNNQEIVFKISKYGTSNTKFPEKMSAEDLLKLKNEVYYWEYFPKGKLTR